ncbi:MAG: hypothetical protein HY093_03035 [Candidatus Liptonbacteria bacterium]|nr:hypothetical protein [Candidatus Liptonbacteria bacterium]
MAFEKLSQTPKAGYPSAGRRRDFWCRERRRAIAAGAIEPPVRESQPGRTFITTETG